jgi:hypothetical protein
MDYKKQISKVCLTFPRLGIEVLNVSTTIYLPKWKLKNHFRQNDLACRQYSYFADTIAGYACLYNLPMLSKSFTTIN